MVNKIDLEKWTHSRIVQHEINVEHTLLRAYLDRSHHICIHFAGHAK